MTSTESSPLLMPFDDVKAAVTEFARGFNHSYYRPFHLAILKGDWESTKAFIDNDPTALTAKVTVLGRTALHVAAVGAQWKLVEKLVQHMPANMAAELDFMGCTCLHYVAMGESVKAAKALVAKNPSLTQVTDCKGFTPLIYSVTSTRCKHMVQYLFMNTTDDGPGRPFSGSSASHLVALLIHAGFYDIIMHLLQCYPNLATLSDSNGSIILNVLSKLPSHFLSGHKLRSWKRCIYYCVPVELEYFPPNQSYFRNKLWNALQTLVPSLKLVRDTKLRHVSAVRLVELVFSEASTLNDYQFWQSFVSPDIIFNATSSGIVEILKTCFLFFPDLVWTHIPNEGYVVQIAIKNRQEKVFNLLRKMPIMCNLLVLALDESNNTTSHLAARVASQAESIACAAFQMQRELHWFKEVEKLDHPLHKDVKNNNGKTAWQVFKEEHKTLLEEGKNWMKDTSNSCMLVATLIATITFAAAITVPGGNNQDKGIPIFLLDKTFMLFIVSDALALFSSMASLLMFLSIIHGRYAKEDFVVALPRRVVLGMASLFFAVGTTMIAFGAALSMLLEKRLVWAPYPIAFLACVPVTLFAKLQFPNLFTKVIDMIVSTYGSPLSHIDNRWV